MKNTIAKRLREIVDYTKKSDAAFGREFGATRYEMHNWLKGVKMNVLRVSQLLEAYPEINGGWFITGNGSMIKADENGNVPVGSSCSNTQCVNEKAEMQAKINELSDKVIRVMEKNTELLQENNDLKLKQHK